MPDRSCIACRSKGAKGELLRVINGPDGAVLDYLERFPGRGAYVCPVVKCITKGLEAGSLSRAFRTKSKTIGVEDFVASVRTAADRKFRSLLGMARKSGLSSYGHDSALKALKSAPGGLLIAADDVSGSILEKLERELGGMDFVLVRYGDKDLLGELMGTRPVGFIYIADEGFASALVKEHNRTLLNTGGE